ncbi:MAG: hypothetical protein WC906_00605 [Parcubacteria group bacterium]|jgi:hypothetical protein
MKMIDREQLSSFQRVCAHPQGALVILGMMRVLANQGAAEDLVEEMNKLIPIYDEIFDSDPRPLLFPELIKEIFFYQDG